MWLCFAFSQQVDGKIKHVCVYGFQKRYSPEKHYVSEVILELNLTEHFVLELEKARAISRWLMF